MTIYLQTAARPAKDLPMSEAERKARVELAACYRIFDMLGWTEMIFNHITLRVPGSEPRFLINPFGLHYREITASSLVRDLGDKHVMILRNHGLLSWGRNVAEAYLRLWTLQRACDVQVAAGQAGGELNRLSQPVIERMLAESGPGETQTCEDVYAALVRLLEARDPSYRD